MRSHATLGDVAQRAGTSVATAGRALGGYGKIAATTRDRVVAAAQQLNYHPNALARSMKQRFTFTIGLIVGNICNSFFARIVRAVETTVMRYGYKVIVCDADENIENELDHARTLLEHRVDGIIVSPTTSVTGEISRATKEIYGGKIPTVFIDRALQGARIPTVVSDNVPAAQEATTHLIRLGHRRIGVVVGRKTLDSMTRRIDGYQRALGEDRIPFDASLVVDGVEVGVEAGYRATTTSRTKAPSDSVDRYEQSARNRSLERHQGKGTNNSWRRRFDRLGRFRCRSAPPKTADSSRTAGRCHGVDCRRTTYEIAIRRNDGSFSSHCLEIHAHRSGILGEKNFQTKMRRTFEQEPEPPVVDSRYRKVA